jgi:hypothetical protein
MKNQQLSAKETGVIIIRAKMKDEMAAAARSKAGGESDNGGERNRGGIAWRQLKRNKIRHRVTQLAGMAAAHQNKRPKKKTRKSAKQRRRKSRRNKRNGAESSAK